jgi:hypothetical protein
MLTTLLQVNDWTDSVSDSHDVDDIVPAEWLDWLSVWLIHAMFTTLFQLNDWADSMSDWFTRCRRHCSKWMTGLTQCLIHMMLTTLFQLNDWTDSMSDWFTRCWRHCFNWKEITSPNEMTRCSWLWRRSEFVSRCFRCFRLKSKYLPRETSENHKYVAGNLVESETWFFLCMSWGCRYSYVSFKTILIPVLLLQLILLPLLREMKFWLRFWERDTRRNIVLFSISSLYTFYSLYFRAIGFAVGSLDLRPILVFSAVSLARSVHAIIRNKHKGRL